MINEEIGILSDSIADLEWFQANSSELTQKYEGEFVAIKNKEIISFAPKIEILIKKLKEKNINDFEVIIQYVQPKGEVIIL